MQICDVCHYQAASRICKSCDLKSTVGVKYCDVCYFNEHRELQAVHPDPEVLTILCCECEQFTAKWMCEGCVPLPPKHTTLQPVVCVVVCWQRWYQRVHTPIPRA